MAHTEEDIIKDVRIVIDEIGINDANFLQGQDDTELDDIIRSKIVESIRFAYLNADWSLLTPISASATGSISNGVLEVTLPKNMLRLYSVYNTDWPYPIQDFVPFGSKEYALLKNPYTTGAVDKPMASVYKITIMDEQRTNLELYKVNDDGSGEAEVSYDYMEEPAKGVGGYDIRDEGKPGTLYDSIIYYIAGMTLLTIKDQHADSLLNQAIGMMGITKK